MPPRRRKRNTARPVPSPSRQPEPEPERSRASASPTSDHESQDGTDAEEALPFFNATFSMYRVSPLYIGKQALTPARLKTLSKRLRDTLVGDVVRGVQVGLESDASLGRTGALEAVEWRWLTLERILGAEPSRDRASSLELGSSGNAAAVEDEEDGSPASRKRRRVLSLELRYENARFSALLLPELDGSVSKGAKDRLSSWTWETNADDTNTNDSQKETVTQNANAFLHLPLLLLRMPAPLRSVLIDFLGSTFDVRISALRLGTRTLVRSWEAWLADSDSGAGPAAKDVSLTLGFHVESPDQTEGSRNGANTDTNADGAVPVAPERPQLSLKSIDITIPGDEIRRFARAGAAQLNRDAADPDPDPDPRPDVFNPTTAHGKRKRKAGPTTAPLPAPTTHKRIRGNHHLAEEGWAWLSTSTSTSTSNPETTTTKQRSEEATAAPFVTALAAHLRAHLALDLFHPAVRVTRIACDGFVASEAGRVRLRSPPSPAPADAAGAQVAVWRFVGALVRRAAGEGGLGVG